MSWLKMFSCDTLKTSSSYGNPVQCVSGTKHYCALRSPQRSNSNPKSNCVEITPSKITPPPPPPLPWRFDNNVNESSGIATPRSNRNRTAIELQSNCIEIALKLPLNACVYFSEFSRFKFPGIAPKPLWNRTETALKPPLNTWIRWCEFRQNLSVFNF